MVVNLTYVSFLTVTWKDHNRPQVIYVPQSRGGVDEDNLKMKMCAPSVCVPPYKTFDVVGKFTCRRQRIMKENYSLWEKESPW